MADDADLARILIQALRRIEADAEGALQRRGNLRQALTTIRDAAGNAAADAAKQIGMAPYGQPDKSA